MLNGVFSALDPPRLAALVSCLVFVEKTNDEVRIKAQLAEPLAQLQVRRLPPPPRPGRLRATPPNARLLLALYRHPLHN